MLKQPDMFLPITTEAGFQAQVSSGFNGDFRVKDVSTGEIYVNFFTSGQTFLRVVKMDILGSSASFEQVEDKKQIKNLMKAKYAYVDRYFEH
jgi:hypothetical protein